MEENMRISERIASTKTIYLIMIVTLILTLMGVVQHTFVQIAAAQGRAHVVRNYSGQPINISVYDPVRITNPLERELKPGDTFTVRTYLGAGMLIEKPHELSDSLGFVGIAGDKWVEVFIFKNSVVLTGDNRKVLGVYQYIYTP